MSGLSSLGCRRDLYSDGQGLCVSGGDYRLVLTQSTRLSNTQDTDFCVEALQQALSRYGRPEIFNTDQGSQFTSEAFIGALQAHDIRISMDGKGRWVDNVFVERL